MAYFTDSSSPTSQQQHQRMLRDEQRLQGERQQFASQQHSQGSSSFNSESKSYPDPGLYTAYPYAPQEQQYQQNATTAMQPPTRYDGFNYPSSYQQSRQLQQQQQQLQQQQQQQQQQQRQRRQQQQQQQPVSYIPNSTSEMHSQELALSFLDGLQTTYPYDLSSSSYGTSSFPSLGDQTARPVASQNDQSMAGRSYDSSPLKEFSVQLLEGNQNVARLSNTETNSSGMTGPMSDRASIDNASFAAGGDNREMPDRSRFEGQRTTQPQQGQHTFKRIFSGFGPKTSKGWKTPVDEGILTEAEAETLFSVFMDRLNPICSLLDPALHTPQWTRSTSPILYTAILMAATQLVYVNRNARLRIFAKSLSGLAFAEGICEIGLCQALFLLGFWRGTEESGGGAWRQVGYAIRVAYELGLHREHVRPLPDDELEARLVLDKERTYYALNTFENLLEIHHSLPGMIDRRAILDPCLWIVDHLNYTNSSDQHTASIWGLTNLYWGLNSLNASKDAKVRMVLVERGKEQMELWKEKWRVVRRGHPGDSPDQNPDAHLFKLHPTSQLLINHYARIADFDFDLLSFLNSGTIASSKAPTFYLSVMDDKESKVVPPKNLAGIKCFVQAVEGALKVVKGMEELKSVLGVMHELTYIGTATATIWLAKNFNQLPAQYETEFLDALYAVQALCQAASLQPSDLCSCQAQFFQSVLLVLIRSKGDLLSQYVDPDGRVNFSWHSSNQQGSPNREQHGQRPRSFATADTDMVNVPNMTVPQVLDLFSKVIPLRPPMEDMF